jgi:hypothetical protein
VEGNFIFLAVVGYCLIIQACGGDVVITIPFNQAKLENFDIQLSNQTI